MQLVKVERNTPFADSQIISKKLGVKHHEVVSVVENVIDDLVRVQPALKTGKFSPKWIEEERSYRNRKFKAYRINRPMFSFVMSRMTKNKKAVKWFAEFNRAFYEMEEMIFREAYNKRTDKWLLTRSKSKSIRKDTMDIVKVFIDYAIAQGASKNAENYYSNITKATYKALELVTIENPKIRDTLEIFELFELTLAEDLVQRKLKEYMDLGRGYKDIFQSLKKDIEAFHTTAKLLKL